MLAQSGAPPRPRGAPVLAVAPAGVEEAAHHPVHPIVEIEEAVADVEERSGGLTSLRRRRALCERRRADQHREHPRKSSPRRQDSRLRGRRGAMARERVEGRSWRELYRAKRGWSESVTWVNQDSSASTTRCLSSAHRRSGPVSIRNSSKPGISTEWSVSR